jgi:hypothetical protein
MLHHWSRQMPFLELPSLPTDYNVIDVTSSVVLEYKMVVVVHSVARVEKHKVVLMEDTVVAVLDVVAGFEAFPKHVSSPT